MFTAVSIAQLVEAGKLSYGDTLAKAWPEYPNRAVAEKITIRQLLSHTSGLGDYFTDEYERTAKDKLRAIKDYLPLFADKPLDFEPGTRFQYSNAGFMVLGGVVQRVSGQDYFDYVREHVYAPAGMKNTDAFEMDHDTPNLAIGYTADRRAGGALVPGKFRNNLYLNVVKGGPAGGGFSTVGDLVAFGDALLRDKLVAPAQVITLTTSRGGPESRYAYGFELDTFRGQHVVGHGGGFDGISAGLELLPDTGLAIAVLANIDNAGGRINDRAEQLFVRASAKAPRPSLREVHRHLHDDRKEEPRSRVSKGNDFGAAPGDAIICAVCDHVVRVSSDVPDEGAILDGTITRARDDLKGASTSFPTEPSRCAQVAHGRSGR